MKGKLHPVDVAFIRHWLRVGFRQCLTARAFGVSRSMVSRIHAGLVHKQ
jgi:hypothetical protein